MKNIRKTILVVDDEEKLRLTIKDFLEYRQYSVLLAKDGEEALDIYYSNNNNIDMILLDVMLPQLDGYGVLKEIREVSDVPVIMLTAKNTESDELKGFRKGADDYITKPFLLSVLDAHMNAILKRTHNKVMEIEKGCLLINVDSHKVYVGTTLLELSPKEYKLLLYFVKHENVVLTRDQLLDAIWGYDYDGGTRSVDTMIKRLRKKLGDEIRIESVYGIGYRFEVDYEKNNKN